jgi:hypothetical protein
MVRLCLPCLLTASWTTKNCRRWSPTVHLLLSNHLAGLRPQNHLAGLRLPNHIAGLLRPVLPCFRLCSWRSPVSFRVAGTPASSSPLRCSATTQELARCRLARRSPIFVHFGDSMPWLDRDRACLLFLGAISHCQPFPKGCSFYLIR